MSSFGFGSNNNNNNTNNTSGFGGFGSSNTGGFGSNTNASSGGSLFGGNTATSGGFGSGGGGFGATQTSSSPFGGSKPAFGAPATTTTGGGLFGNNTATSGGFGGSGGFGATNNTTSGGFGGNTSGGLFGQSKPATGGFGSSNTGGSLFGGGNTSGGFGASNTTNSNPFSSNTNANTNSGFGASNTATTGSGFAFGASSSTANNNNNNNNNGTAGTPFNAVSEKDGGPGGQTSMYQSITFQPPYINKSFEELRTEDYAQGRRFGNSNGQAGSFGQSTGFGNFGATSTSGGGLFGGSNTATSGNAGFGATNSGFGASNTGSFGSNTNTGGGLFGAQSKPASGGLFGTANAGTTTGGFGNNTNTSTGGGLFGGSTGGFGSNTNTANTGGGLFGSNSQQQNKPAFGGFGQTHNTAGGFGSNANTNTGGGLFGGNASTSNTGGSLFGQNNQQQQSNPFGGNTNTSGGLFANQNKPAAGGLFGSNTNTSNTGGGLFGAQNSQPQQSNPFGQSTNTGGGLFGAQNQNKPTGTGLFGSTANTNTGGGLFGSQQNQQGGSSLFGGGGNTNTGSSLFGNQNKPAGGSLFGGNTNTSNTGTGLFGSQQNQQNNNGSSLFGGSLGQNNQNQQSTNTNSLFGPNMNQSNQQSMTQDNKLHASLTGAPYGNEQLFSSLAAPSPPIGPLATPLSGARPAPRKTQSLLSSARLNTPVYSPRGGSIGRNGSFGFSYSTYGTPGSAYTSGSLTPGASSLLKPTGSLSSALTSRLNKSYSTSNLRGDSTAGEGRSLLRPSAFSPEGTPGRYQNGSVRKLNIDRSLRVDLFNAQPKAIEAAKENDGPSLRKRVSFENAGNNTAAEPNASNALVRTETPEEDNASTAPIRAGPSRSKAPEMEQVNGALSTVPEDTVAPRPSSAPSSKMPAEKISKRTEVGDYWTKPAMKDLKNMSRQQLKSVGNFVVGRDGVGRIEFGSVDLTNTPLDDICGNIVQLTPRSATVYQDDNDKPSVGKALNVPSTIHLDNSWPRSHGGKKPVTSKSGRDYDKHIARLKRVSGTHFLKYDPDTGVWSFKVDHFTTYGLDDDDDESEFQEDTDMHNESSVLSDPPQTPDDEQDMTLQSMGTGTGEMDDTFQFKLDRRSQLENFESPRLPGGFESEVTYDYDDPSADEDMEPNGHTMSGGLGNLYDPFISSGGAVRAPSPSAVDRYHSSMMEDAQDKGEPEQDMPGSFIAEPKMPKSILKPSTAFNAFVSPEKLATEAWEEQLQRTMSPKKRDRQALKDMQQVLLREREDDVVESPFKKSMLAQGGLDGSYLAQRSAKKAKADGDTKSASKKDSGRSQGFKTHMDIMNSIHEPETKGRKIMATGKGFEFPQSKKPRLSSFEDMDPLEKKWHENYKPSFFNNGTLAYSVPGAWPAASGELATAMQGFVGEKKDVRFAGFVPAADINPMTLVAQKEVTTINTSTGFPAALAPHNILFSSLVENVDPNLSIATHERSIWKLCSVLFDPLHTACAAFIEGIPAQKIDDFATRMRFDALGAYWAQLVSPSVQDGLKRARTAEEKALLYLTQNDVVAACEALMGARDFKLATLVSQLPGTEISRAMMQKQVDEWRNRNDWSEMSEPVRALYSVLAGQVCTVQGKTATAENRATEFNIAERFGLSWQQSFALRFFFGGHQTIVQAIEAYSADLESDRERVQPSNTLPNGNKTRDTILDLLQIFVGNQDAMPMLNPLAVSGSAFNSRLTWQLASLLNAKGKCTVPDEKLDQITYDFGTELELAGKLVSSTWILLHLRDDQARQEAVAGLLERNAGKISTPGSDADGGNFENLVQDNCIPEAFIWRAKALYAQAGLRNSSLQTDWLLRAGDVDEAHKVLCTTLGPQAVIEQDYDDLYKVLQHFARRQPVGWERGGQVYGDFVRLVRAHSSQRWSDEAQVSMQQLRRGLTEMEEDERKKSLEERVAIHEMWLVMGEVDREHGDPNADMSMGGVEFDDRAAPFGADMLNKYQQAMGLVA